MPEYALPWVVAVGVTLLALVILLVMVLVRQGRLAAREEVQQAQAGEALAETMTGYVERLMQEIEQRRQADAARDLSLTQGLLHDSSQATAARLDALGQRVDQAGIGQEQRLGNISRVLEERLTANDQKVERMRETLYTSVTNMQKENAQKLDEMRKTVDE
ncbi:MAG: hypothetical protein GX650_01945, partial [Clostridiales bacterium]|nr:hypothetical protein [Clostridiales bacterium]